MSTWQKEVAHELHTQDNRATSHPIFLVQQKHRIYGLEAGYTDDFVSIDPDGDVYPDVEEDDPAYGDGWRTVGYKDEYEFVTVCFTHKAAQEYIVANAHNLTEPRIYVESGWRNTEWQRVRALLMDQLCPVCTEPTTGGYDRYCEKCIES